MNRQVPVAATNSEISQMRGPHEAYWSPEAAGHTLLVTFGGTNSIPSDLKAFAEAGASLGMDVITLDYDNSVISTTCKDSQDIRCFDKFREEVATGKDVSPLVRINKVNSLEFRIQELIKYLAKTEPLRWEKYLSGKNLDWKKMVLSGHSQGSGHAAYLAKNHTTLGVAMLAGPQDRFEDGRPVPWLSRKSKTPATQYFSFLHQRDFFGSQHQVAAMKILLGSEDTSGHIEMINDEVQDPHNSVLLDRFSAQWIKLLTEASRKPQ